MIYRGVAEREVRRACAKHGLSFFTVPAHHFVFIYRGKKANHHLVSYNLEWPEARIDLVVNLFKVRAKSAVETIMARGV